jgi:drug/metabolite transporter (DMT)-like permease
LFTTVIATGFGWMPLSYELRRMPAGMASLGMLAMPIVGVQYARRRLGEQPSAFEASAMLLIAVGLSLLAWNGLRANARTKATV